MPPLDAVERALQRSFSRVTGPSTPSRLRSAMRHAVFGGGGRVRPRLVLQTALACGREASRSAKAAAVAIEFLHCASLVHDDLPCFDDAPLRRGKPSVHAAYGVETAVLTGDALIVAAFQTLATEAEHDGVPSLLSVVADGVGAVRGLVAGQAWESEPVRDLKRYHRAKTAALFEASVRAGAIAGGGIPERWAEVGALIGEAYQVADDIVDVVGNARSAGKPTGRDALFDRPSAASELGLQGARTRMLALVEQTVARIPACPRRESFESFVRGLARRLEEASQATAARAYEENRRRALRVGA